MKCLVETTGNHMLIHTRTGEEIQAHRPSLCQDDDFTHAQLGIRSLRMLARDIPVSVTDEEWEICWNNCDGDTDLAVASFIAELNGPYVEGTSEPLAEGEPAPYLPPLAEVIAPTKKPKK